MWEAGRSLCDIQVTGKWCHISKVIFAPHKSFLIGGFWHRKDQTQLRANLPWIYRQQVLNSFLDVPMPQAQSLSNSCQIVVQHWIFRGIAVYKPSMHLNSCEHLELILIKRLNPAASQEFLHPAQSPHNSTAAGKDPASPKSTPTAGSAELLLLLPGIYSLLQLLWTRSQQIKRTLFEERADQKVTLAAQGCSLSNSISGCWE